MHFGAFSVLDLRVQFTDGCPILQCSDSEFLWVEIINKATRTTLIVVS